ncbi:hypothetical protein TELCIR_02738 [Teladorsagia circumcincta]|uniref:Uncharacterized protein n=1 Tax=Teladorsagia circumcincta TaxID=45464 RepID=A0A2G9UY90_TELCI|nr:hypothetical protein TELCIR_02738 [Teladorsagia circumcincta]
MAALNIVHVGIEQEPIHLIMHDVTAMEMASTLAESASKVTVICDTNEPMPILGADIGITIRKQILAEHMCGPAPLTEELTSHSFIGGHGTQPPTDFLKGTNVKLDEDGYILVDSNFKLFQYWGEGLEGRENGY